MSTQSSDHGPIARDISVTVVVDHVRGRVYDSRYLAPTHTPRGRASNLHSPASASTRANLAAAFELGPNAALDHCTIQEQWRSRIHEDRFDRARSSLRGACRFGMDRRSQPADRVDADWLRTWTTSHRRQGDVVRPTCCRGDGRSGTGAGGVRDPRPQRVGLDSASHVRSGHPRRRRTLNSPRSFARRPAISATAWRPSWFPETAQLFGTSQPSDRRLTAAALAEPR
jgi:hypothetical protein